MSKFKVENHEPTGRYILVEPIEIKDIYQIRIDEGEARPIIRLDKTRLFSDYLQHPTRGIVRAVSEKVEELDEVRVDDIITYKSSGEPMMINGEPMLLLNDAYILTIVEEDKKETFDINLDTREKQSSDMKSAMKKKQPKGYSNIIRSKKPNIIQ